MYPLLQLNLHTETRIVYDLLPHNVNTKDYPIYKRVLCAIASYQDIGSSLPTSMFSYYHTHRA